MTFSLVKKIMDEIGSSRIRSLGDPKPTLWPSQASAITPTGVVGKCIRNSFYEKMGVKPTDPIDSEIKIMGFMGTKIEDGLIEIIKNIGKWENNNVKWQANGLSGEVDVICREETESGLKRFIVEAKSCQGYYANKEIYGYSEGRGNTKVWIKGSPKDAHLMQAAIYAHISREQCEGTLILYVSRDEAKLKEFWITVDNDGRIYIDGIPELRFTMNDIYARYQSLREHIEQNILPPKDFKHTYSNDEVEDIFNRKGLSKTARDLHISGKKAYQDKACQYCAYQKQCIRDADSNETLASTPNAEISVTTLEDAMSSTVETVVTEENAPSASSVASSVAGLFDFWDMPSQTQANEENKPELFLMGSL